MPDASGPIGADAVLRYQTRIERLSISTARLIITDIAAVIGEIDEKLADFDGDGRALLRLQALRANLASYREGLQEGVRTALGEAIAVTLQTTAPMLAAAGFVSEAPPLAVLSRIGEREFDGRTWARWGAKLADDAMARIEGDLRRAIASGEAIPKTRDRLQKTLGLSKQSARRLAITALNDVSNAARIEVVRAIGSDVVDGWVFVATLDSRTSFICAGLDRTEYALNDPNLPRPPRHPNCRSVLVPRTKARALFPEMTRASMNGPVKATTDFEAFLHRQGEEFQREYLGETRLRAWRRGLPLSKMATVDRELSIAELRALYPDKVAA